MSLLQKEQFIILQKDEISENKDYLNSFIKKDERKIWTLILGGPTKYYDYSTKNMKHIFHSIDINC